MSTWGYFFLLQVTKVTKKNHLYYSFFIPDVSLINLISVYMVIPSNEVLE